MNQLNFLKITKQRQLLRCEKFLNEMDQVIPWETLCDLINPHRPLSATGRKPKSTELMLRTHCLQRWYSLSDPCVEGAIKDWLSFQRFLRLDPSSDTVPDVTTILNFSHLLEDNGLQKSVFTTINAHLEGKGLLMKRGTLFDATRIAAPTSTKNTSGKRDPEMSSTKKGNLYYFGIKAHIDVDSDNSLIHLLTGTKAKRHNSNQQDKLLQEQEQIVGGDKGYADDLYRKQYLPDGSYMSFSLRGKATIPCQTVRKEVISNDPVGKPRWSIHFRSLNANGAFEKCVIDV